MTENTDITQAQDTQAQDKQPVSMSAAMESPRNPLPDMKGRVNRHTSGYWALTIPALSVRYLAEAGADIFGASRSSIAKKIGIPKLAKISEKTIDKAYAAVVGVFMMFVSTFYMKRTYDDIKGAFSEAVGMEMGKKPEDVGFRDLLKSDNTLVEAARHNFFKYNARRFAVNTPFFANLVLKESIKPKNAVLLGTAANSLYLMNDVLHRKETFFERLQSFVDSKIIHSEEIGSHIKAVDLINLYELHSRDKDSKYVFQGRMDTQDWQNKEKIFGRMATLLNKTYGNAPNDEKANFSLPKMIYLMGHGMVDSAHADRSCMMIEAANRYGIEAVKDIATHGSDAAYAAKKYPSIAGNECAPQEQSSGEFSKKFAADAGMSKVEQVAAQQQRAANNPTIVQTA